MSQQQKLYSYTLSDLYTLYSNIVILAILFLFVLFCFVLFFWNLIFPMICIREHCTIIKLYTYFIQTLIWAKIVSLKLIIIFF